MPLSLPETHRHEHTGKPLRSVDRRRTRAQIDVGETSALIEILAQSGNIEPEVTVESAADAFYGLVNEEAFQLLTGDCGWDVDRFRRWVTGLMVYQLLGADATTA